MKQLRVHIEKCVYVSKESWPRTHGIFQQCFTALCSHTHGRVTKVSGFLKNISTSDVKVGREHYLHYFTAVNPRFNTEPNCWPTISPSSSSLISLMLLRVTHTTTFLICLCSNHKMKVRSSAGTTQVDQGRGSTPLQIQMERSCWGENVSGVCALNQNLMKT